MLTTAPGSHTGIQTQGSVAPPQPGEAGGGSSTPMTDEDTEAPGRGAAVSGRNGRLAGEKEHWDWEQENLGPHPGDSDYELPTIFSPAMA